MAKFVTKANKGTSSVQSVSLVLCAASSPRRFQVYDVVLGSGDTTADTNFVHICQKCTTVGTGTTLTPQPLDSADSAATTVAKDTVTADPTLTSGAYLYWIPLNQRATFRWSAAPYGELVMPATANAGAMLGLNATTATKFDYTVFFEEQ